MTNADRIRGMSDEELAEWICGVYDDDESSGKFINGILIERYDEDIMLDWLQQPCGNGGDGMTFKIHYMGSYPDELIVSGETIEEIREIAFAECDRRGWEKEKCWSEEI